MNQRVIEQLEKRYKQDCEDQHPSCIHLPTLRHFAQGCDLAIEFGTHAGRSATALLLSARRVISYDIKEHAKANELKELVGNTYWSYRIQDTRTALVPPCDFLFVDSDHTYDQVKAELDAHADKVKKRIAFHDTMTYGVRGMDGEPDSGIRHAIDELMIRDPTWQLTWASRRRHGLIVLDRRGQREDELRHLRDFLRSPACHA